MKEKEKQSSGCRPVAPPLLPGVKHVVVLFIWATINWGKSNRNLEFDSSQLSTSKSWMGSCFPFLIPIHLHLCCAGRPVWPAAAARSTTPLEVTLRMTSEWDACSQTHPAPTWQRRSREVAAFARTRGTVWSWQIRWCHAKTRPSAPRLTTGRRPASTRNWWASVRSAGAWLLQ